MTSKKITLDKDFNKEINDRIEKGLKAINSAKKRVKKTSKKCTTRKK